jgi:uncharacterized OB-fold protein
MKQYPQPREDADNAEFLNAWREGHLVLQACRQCTKVFFYPRPVCPYCWSDELENRMSPGRGRIVSYSLVHRPNDPAFEDETPIVLAEVALSEGATLLARIINAPVGEIHSRVEVELPKPEIAKLYPLPVFQLRPPR